MENRIENIPNASILIHSMRSIGYDFESAIADIIDNSISAEAKNIFITFPIEDGKEIFINFFDDGFGMNRVELIEAMRFGSVKDHDRSKTDLGRFGLGLKTASISQCKRVTAISKKDGDINGFYWDLDVITNSEAWEMIELTSDELDSKLATINQHFNLSCFTLIIWEKLDTLQKDITFNNNIENVFLSHIESAEKHLSLVFHRFLEEGININFNGIPLLPLDPFLSRHNKTTIKPEQIINTKTSKGLDEKVKVQVFVLPYFKDFSNADYIKIGGEEQINNQGFYIYRNKRLMMHGTWFKIKPKAELSRNARIRVDIPNTLDDLWSIDIKKQNAIIPKALLEQLKGEVIDAVEKSKKLHKYKGNIQVKPGSIWNKITNNRNNTVLYEVNQNSPLIEKLFENIDNKSVRKIKNILSLIELSLPYKDIYNSVAEKKEINIIPESKRDELLLQARFLFQSYKKTTNKNDDTIIDLICEIEPFASANIKKELKEKILWIRKA